MHSWRGMWRPLWEWGRGMALPLAHGQVHGLQHHCAVAHGGVENNVQMGGASHSLAYMHLCNGCMTCPIQIYNECHALD